MVASAGITFGEKTGWSSALGWRYISSRPLTEDGVFQSPPLNTINANVGIDRIADAHSSFGIHLHSIAEAVDTRSRISRDGLLARAWPPP